VAAFTRDFGPYAGFRRTVYWFGNWIGNIAIACCRASLRIAAFGRRAVGRRSRYGHQIWLLTVANILGPRVVGMLEIWTMSLALVDTGTHRLVWFQLATFLVGT
jgi:arginine:agmatine antiporter